MISLLKYFGAVREKSDLDNCFNTLFDKICEIIDAINVQDLSPDRRAIFQVKERNVSGFLFYNEVGSLSIRQLPILLYDSQDLDNRKLLDFQLGENHFQKECVNADKIASGTITVYNFARDLDLTDRHFVRASLQSNVFSSITYSAKDININLIKDGSIPLEKLKKDEFIFKALQNKKNKPQTQRIPLDIEKNEYSLKLILNDYVGFGIECFIEADYSTDPDDIDSTASFLLLENVEENEDFFEFSFFLNDAVYLSYNLLDNNKILIHCISPFICEIPASVKLSFLPDVFFCQGAFVCQLTNIKKEGFLILSRAGRWGEHLLKQPSSKIQMVSTIGTGLKSKKYEKSGINEEGKFYKNQIEYSKKKEPDKIEENENIGFSFYNPLPGPQKVMESDVDTSVVITKKVNHEKYSIQVTNTIPLQNEVPQTDAQEKKEVVTFQQSTTQSVEVNGEQKPELEKTETQSIVLEEIVGKEQETLALKKFENLENKSQLVININSQKIEIEKKDFGTNAETGEQQIVKQEDFSLVKQPVEVKPAFGILSPQQLSELSIEARQEIREIYNPLISHVDAFGTTDVPAALQIVNQERLDLGRVQVINTDFQNYVAENNNEILLESQQKTFKDDENNLTVKLLDSFNIKQTTVEKKIPLTTTTDSFMLVKTTKKTVDQELQVIPHVTDVQIQLQIEQSETQAQTDNTGQSQQTIETRTIELFLPKQIKQVLYQESVITQVEIHNTDLKPEELLVVQNSTVAIEGNQVAKEIKQYADTSLQTDPSDPHLQTIRESAVEITGLNDLAQHTNIEKTKIVNTVADVTILANVLHERKKKFKEESAQVDLLDDEEDKDQEQKDDEADKEKKDAIVKIEEEVEKRNDVSKPKSIYPQIKIQSIEKVNNLTNTKTTSSQVDTKVIDGNNLDRGHVKIPGKKTKQDISKSNILPSGGVKLDKMSPNQKSMVDSTVNVVRENISLKRARKSLQERIQKEEEQKKLIQNLQQKQQLQSVQQADLEEKKKELDQDSDAVSQMSAEIVQATEDIKEKNVETNKQIEEAQQKLKNLQKEKKLAQKKEQEQKEKKEQALKNWVRVYKAILASKVDKKVDEMFIKNGLDILNFIQKDREKIKKQQDIIKKQKSLANSSALKVQKIAEEDRTRKNKISQPTSVPLSKTQKSWAQNSALAQYKEKRKKEAEKALKKEQQEREAADEAYAKELEKKLEIERMQEELEKVPGYKIDTNKKIDTKQKSAIGPATKSSLKKEKTKKEEKLAKISPAMYTAYKEPVSKSQIQPKIQADQLEDALKEVFGDGILVVDDDEDTEKLAQFEKEEEEKTLEELLQIDDILQLNELDKTISSNLGPEPLTYTNLKREQDKAILRAVQRGKNVMSSIEEDIKGKKDADTKTLVNRYKKLIDSKKPVSKIKKEMEDIIQENKRKIADQFRLDLREKLLYNKLSLFMQPKEEDKEKKASPPPIGEIFAERLKILIQVLTAIKQKKNIPTYIESLQRVYADTFGILKPGTVIRYRENAVVMNTPTFSQKGVKTKIAKYRNNELLQAGIQVLEIGQNFSVSNKYTARLDTKKDLKGLMPVDLWYQVPQDIGNLLHIQQTLRNELYHIFDNQVIKIPVQAQKPALKLVPIKEALPVYVPKDPIKIQELPPPIKLPYQGTTDLSPVPVKVVIRAQPSIIKGFVGLRELLPRSENYPALDTVVSNKITFRLKSVHRMDNNQQIHFSAAESQAFQIQGAVLPATMIVPLFKQNDVDPKEEEKKQARLARGEIDSVIYQQTTRFAKGRGWREPLQFFIYPPIFANLSLHFLLFNYMGNFNPNTSFGPSSGSELWKAWMADSKPPYDVLRTLKKELEQAYKDGSLNQLVRKAVNFIFQELTKNTAEKFQIFYEKAGYPIKSDFVKRTAEKFIERVKQILEDNPTEKQFSDWKVQNRKIIIQTVKQGYEAENKKADLILAPQGRIIMASDVRHILGAPMDFAKQMFYNPILKSAFCFKHLITETKPLYGKSHFKIIEVIKEKVSKKSANYGALVGGTIGKLLSTAGSATLVGSIPVIGGAAMAGFALWELLNSGKTVTIELLRLKFIYPERVVRAKIMIPLLIPREAYDEISDSDITAYVDKIYNYDNRVNNTGEDAEFDAEATVASLSENEIDELAEAQIDVQRAVTTSVMFQYLGITKYSEVFTLSPTKKSIYFKVGTNKWVILPFSPKYILALDQDIEVSGMYYPSYMIPASDFEVPDLTPILQRYITLTVTWE